MTLVSKGTKNSELFCSSLHMKSKYIISKFFLKTDNMTSSVLSILQTQKEDFIQFCKPNPNICIICNIGKSVIFKCRNLQERLHNCWRRKHPSFQGRVYIPEFSISTQILNLHQNSKEVIAFPLHNVLSFIAIYIYEKNADSCIDLLFLK